MSKLKRQTLAFLLMIGASAGLLLTAPRGAALVGVFALANLLILLTR